MFKTFLLAEGMDFCGIWLDKKIVNQVIPLNYIFIKGGSAAILTGRSTTAP